MAGSISRTLWPWGSARSSSRRESRSPTGRPASPAAGGRAAWRSPTIDRRVGNSSEPASPPAPRSRSRSTPSHDGRADTPSVRFASATYRHAPDTVRIHRPWRAATPFPPSLASITRGSAFPPADTTEVHMPTVDMEPSRRLAYAFVDPPCADPGQFIRIALERRGGDPPVRLAPSSYGTMMVVFGHAYFRESTLRRGPFHLDGHWLRFERHEDAEFRVLCPYRRLVELAATNFPAEHCNEDGIRTAFHAFGQVCSIARSSLREVEHCRHHGVADYSVVRVLVLMDENRRITPFLLVRNPNYEVSSIVNIRVVGEWAHPPGTPPPVEHDFADDADDGTPPPDRFTPQRTSSGLFRTPRARFPFPSSRAAGLSGQGGAHRALGTALYPSVPLWTFVSGAFTALARALSLAAVPRVIIRDLPPPTRPHTPPPPSAALSDSDEITFASRQLSSNIPSLCDLLDAEEHEVSLRKRRARRRRAAESASKLRRSRRLAAKEDPFYVDATTKASKMKEAQLDLSKASERMKKAIQASGVLERPAPAKISSRKLCLLGRVCGLNNLSEIEDEVPING
ncbi:unnamed protein product [Urochloa humidicola]